jgi:hypothetical protein
MEKNEYSIFLGIRTSELILKPQMIPGRVVAGIGRASTKALGKKRA